MEKGVLAIEFSDIMITWKKSFLIKLVTHVDYWIHIVVALPTNLQTY